MKTIIITGTPGSGKTSVSIKISEKINAKVISLNELALNKGFNLKYDKNRETYVIDLNKLVPYIENLIISYQNEKFDFLIIEGHFSDIISNNLIDYIIILRTNPYVLWKRLESRGYNTQKIRENVQSEILGSCTNYVIQKKANIPTFEIDTSNLSIAALVKIIYNLINNLENRKKFQVGKIDWLEYLAEKDSIHEFFN